MSEMARRVEYAMEMSETGAGLLVALAADGLEVVETWRAKPHVPTPDELDDLLAQVSACGYASEATEVVETWTRKWWNVESGITTKYSSGSAGVVK